MKRLPSPWTRGCLMVSALAFSLMEAGAQGLTVGVAGGAGAAIRPAASAGATPLADAVAIRKMPRLNSARDWTQRTPVFVGPTSRSPKDWGVFEVVFDSKPEWIDELAVTFHLMLQSPDAQAQQPFSLYRLTSRYQDVAGGRGKTISAVLLPAALLRHGRPIGLAVEFAVEGQVIASQSEVLMPFLGERWWENPQIVDSPRTVKREGYLLERAKTPFGLVNIDDNEVSK